MNGWSMITLGVAIPPPGAQIELPMGVPTNIGSAKAGATLFVSIVDLGGAPYFRAELVQLGKPSVVVAGGGMPIACFALLESWDQITITPASDARAWLVDGCQVG